MEPKQVYAGASWSWETTVSGYSAADGYSIEYIFTNASNSLSFTDDGTATGETFAIELAAATTAAYTAGDYVWSLFAIKALERIFIASGGIEIIPDITDGSTAYDARTHVKKTLDAIEAVLEGKASKDQMSYSVAGRSISRYSPEELVKWRKQYASEYAQECNAAAIEAGRGNNRIIKTHFLGANP